MKLKLRDFFDAAERVAERVLDDDSVVDKATEFRRRMLGIAVKDSDLLRVWDESFYLLQRIFEDVELLIQFRDMSNEELEEIFACFDDIEE